MHSCTAPLAKSSPSYTTSTLSSNTCCEMQRAFGVRSVRLCHRVKHSNNILKDAQLHRSARQVQVIGVLPAANVVASRTLLATTLVARVHSSSVPLYSVRQYTSHQHPSCAVAANLDGIQPYASVAEPGGQFLQKRAASLHPHRLAHSVHPTCRVQDK